MIQCILMLLGLTFPSDSAAIASNNVTVITTQSSASNSRETAEDTSGETGNIPPPKK